MAGKTFERMTDSDVVVNDVYVDPRDSNRVLLATDRGGVLASQDAGVTFTQSNQGISERKVAALLVDRTDPDRLYAGVVNDKKYRRCLSFHRRRRALGAVGLRP